MVMALDELSDCRLDHGRTQTLYLGNTTGSPKAMQMDTIT